MPVGPTGVTFNYTGGLEFSLVEPPKIWVVPEGIYSIKVELQGGSSSRRGGKVEATLSVTPGEELYIYVPGWAELFADNDLTLKSAWPYGGWAYGGASPGAGLAAITSGGELGLGGEILAIAGGAGGRGSAPMYRAGGKGGGLVGEDGVSDGSVIGGSGGTQISGGAAGSGGDSSGGSLPGPGEFGTGGTGGYTPGNLRAGGGGGAGYWGGGGGDSISGGSSSGGGGGSSYTHPTRASDVTHTQGGAGLFGRVGIDWGESQPTTLTATNYLQTYISSNYTSLPVPLTIEAERLDSDTFRFTIEVLRDVLTTPIPGIGTGTGLDFTIDALTSSNGLYSGSPEDVWWDEWIHSCFDYLEFEVVNIENPVSGPDLAFISYNFQTPNGEDISAGTTYVVDIRITSTDLCEIYLLSTHASLTDAAAIYYSGVDPTFYTLVTPVEEEPEPFFLTWLEPGSKAYERGVDRGVLYFNDGRVVPWNGLTEVRHNFGRSSEPTYFDGTKLSETVSMEGFSAQVSAITYPKQFEELYGNAPLRRGVYLGNQRPKTFGFSYRSKIGTDLNEDAGHKIHLVYNALAIPDSRSYVTISDEPNLTEFGWEFRTTPEGVNGRRSSAYIVFNTTKISQSLLTELEGILYGREDSAPYLPSLNQLVNLINNFETFITITDNGDGTWSASTDAEGYINSLGEDIYEIQEANIQWTSSDSYFISSTPDPPD